LADRSIGYAEVGTLLKRVCGALAAASGMLIIGILPAFAQFAPSTTTWYVTVGGWGVFAPEYMGSDSLTFTGRPILSWRKEGGRDWLSMPNDGLGIALIETDTFRAGPVGSVRFARDIDINQRGFDRVGSIETSVEAGAFAEYWPAQWLRTRLEVRYGMIGAGGIVADLTADAVFRPDSQWTFAFGPRLSLASGNYMDDYFGVTAAQAAATGLTTYEAGSGLHSYGVGAFARYRMTPQWTTYASAEYARLAGSATDSPIVNDRHGSPDQFTVGLGLSYTFAVNW
jgi:outer membrane protein